MKLYKRIISGFLAIAIAISLTVPAFAVDPDLIVGAMQIAPDFGSWLWSTMKGTVNTIGSFISDDVCPGSSEEPGYNFRHDFVPRDTVVGGKTGTFYICQNCGKAAGEVLAPAYDTYVTTLPAQGCNSAGNLTWQPTVADLSSYDFWFQSKSGSSYTFSEVYIVNSAGNGFSQTRSGDFYVNFVYSEVKVSTFPLAGTYRVLDSHAFLFRGVFSGEVRSYNRSYELGEWKHFSPGDSFRVTSSHLGPINSISAFADVSTPVFEIIPDTALSADTYNINTRPTSITGGNYGIVGDNGQITKVEDNSTIINETNNTYYNPATGQTVPITGWTYDYSDRSYKVIMEGGKTSTVTYGDENITITETTVNESGDTITNNYTIYYLIDGSGSENPPSTCEHAWTETSSTLATCIMPGSKLLTCSKCQQTRKEAIPALGHDWQVKQTVATEYDESGQLVQEGYVIYECSRCQEQYKAASGTSPPVNPSDPDASGDGVFSGIFGLLLDFLGFFFKTFKDFTKSGVKAFLQALQDGSNDIFGLLNPFDWSA